jgi:HNH endonuclease
MDLSTVSHQEIVDYWTARESECGLAVDWAEAHERCWRCGYKSHLQKCHIIPKSLGGKGDPSNLVLLCGRCHREAPNVADSRFMWIWMRATCVPFYDLYWTTRGVEEFEKMFGRKPFTSIEFDPVSENNALELLREEIKKATIHFGEGRMNPSTIASIFALIEERITHHIPSTPLSSSQSRYFLETVGTCGNVKNNKR